LLFNLLEARHIDACIKNNIIVGLADICYRYPLDMDPFLPRLINCLSEKDLSIKRTSLVIITHLILMDLLKTK
jgi:condensin complex subunit 1